MNNWILKAFNGSPLKWHWVYRNKEGEIIGATARYDRDTGGKDIIPYFTSVPDGFKIGAHNKPRPLFGLDSLKSTERSVFIVEGEKCAAALHSLGFQAITWQGGAQQVQCADWDSLNSYRRVYVFPDNDQPGNAAMQQLAPTLQALPQPPSVYTVTLPDMGQGADVVDLIQQHLPSWDGYRPIPSESVATISELIKQLIKDHSVLLPSRATARPIETQGAESFEWPEVVPFSNSHGLEIPCSLLPGTFGEFASALSNAMETPTALATMITLGSLSTAASCKFEVQVQEGWKEPLNIFTLIALEPGSRKSPVFSSCLAPIQAWDLEQREIKKTEIRRQQAERLNQEELIQKIRREAVRQKDDLERRILFDKVQQLTDELQEIEAYPATFTTDATPEALSQKIAEQGGRFAVLSDEAGILEVMNGLYSEGKANLDIYLKGWDGGAIRIDRKGSSLDCNPYLSVVLAIQPKIVFNLGKKNALQGNGLMERFLWVIPRSNLGERSNRTRAVPPELIEAYSVAIKCILSLPNENRLLRLSIEANNEFLNFRDCIESQIGKGKELCEIAGWASKLPGQAVRIAGLLHIGEYGSNCPTEISRSTLMIALELAALLRSHALVAFAAMCGDSVEYAARKLLEYVYHFEDNKFSATELRKRVKNAQALKGDKLADAVKELVSRGYLRQWEGERPKKGKPISWLQLNASLSSTKNTRNTSNLIPESGLSSLCS
jgi:replicative DNA helicase